MTFSSQCASELAIKSLDLINRLQAQNKDLTETIHNLTIEKDALFDKAEELKVEVEKLNKEIQITKDAYTMLQTKIEIIIKLNLSVKLTTKDIDEKIRTYKAKTSIKLDAKINKESINEQIKTFKPRSTIYLKAKLKKGEIAEEIRNYKPGTPVAITADFKVGRTQDVDTKITSYIMIFMMKITIYFLIKTYML